MKTWEPKPPGTLWATPALLQDSSFTNIEIYDDFLLTVFSIFCSLVLSIMNLKLSYANHELLYISFLPVKKEKNH
jgi:hypothetical protein